MSLNEKKVKRLVGMMNSMSQIAIPPMKPIIECFELAMCEETMEFLLAAGTAEYSLDELKEVYRKNFGDESFAQHWDTVWAEIREMNFLVPGEQDHSKLHMASIFPGWIELSVSGPLTPKREAIIKKFMDFWAILKKLNIAPIRMLTNIKGDMDKEKKPPHMSTLLSPGTRTINLDEPLTSEQQIRTAGDVYQLLAKNKDEIAVMNCICRTNRMISGNGECEHGLPLEGCMNIGPFSKQLVENGISRKVTFEEAVELLEEFERKGAIHTTFHYGGNADREAVNICNCCNDCCLLYNGYKTGDISQIFVRAFYSPKMIDESRCVGCNLCGKNCATGATYYDKENKKLVFDYDACVGCGQCVTQCHFNVREMIPDERSVFAKTKKI